MAQRESLWQKHPDYPLAVEPAARRLEARVGAALVASSERALIVREGRYAPVVYFPREDVRLELLEATDHESFCPFKGQASYWTLCADGRELENAAWSYESPYEQVAALKGHLAFYADRVDVDSAS